MENPFSLKGKITRQTPNQFHYSQINYNISCVYLMAKKKKSILFFFTLTHTNYLPRRWQRFALSSLVLFSFSFSFPYSSPWLSFQRQQYLTLSSLAIFSKVAPLYSLHLGYLIKGSNPLLSPPWLLLSENTFFFLGFTLYFPFPHGPKPSIFFFFCIFVYL